MESCAAGDGGGCAQAPVFDREALRPQVNMIMDSVLAIDSDKIEKHPLNELFEKSVQNQQKLLNEVSRITKEFGNLAELNNEKIISMEIEAEKIRCKLNANYMHGEELRKNDFFDMKSNM